VAQFAIATSSWVVMMRLMARFGNEALAGYTFAIRIIIFTLLPAWGMGNAAATLVGQNLGAGQPERAEKSVYLTGCYNMAFLSVVSVVFIFFGEVLMRVFTSEAEVILVGTDCLRVLGFGYVLYGWGMVLVQSFNGAGDTMTPTWLNLFTFWAFQIPLAWFLTSKIGHAGVYWAVMCSDVLLFFLVLPLFRRGKWKTKIV
jgi:Na+-driven multidrug efflux pump